MLSFSSVALVLAAVQALPEHVPGELLVKFESGAGRSFQAQALASVKGSITEHIVTPAMRTAGDSAGLLLVKVSGDLSEAILTLESQPGVAYAEPNYIWRHQAITVNDPYYTSGQLWGMQGSTTTPQNQYGTGAWQAWQNRHAGSSLIHVGVIDEGIMMSHPDIGRNGWINPYDPIDGIDNDGNGFIDDRNGWDFVSNNNSVYDGVADNHGTHVAGTIGAQRSSIGVIGMAIYVKMISVKFLGSSGGTTANAVKSFDYLTDLKNRHGIDIVASNNSWGGGGYSQALVDAITRHGNANILAVFAAGNSNRNMDSVPSYPASYSNANIVSVASITSTGARSSFSNYGATTCDLGAPGSGIWSTVPTSSGPGYASYNGTSMAAPHVTGAAVIWASQNAGRGLAIKNAIMATTTPTTSLAGLCVTGGRLNVASY